MSNESKNLHLFSPTVARVYGLEAAIIYQRLKWVCKRRGSYAVTKAELLQVFPYLTRKTLITALTWLRNPSTSFERPLISRTSDHKNPTYRIEVSLRTKKLHSFDPEIATQLGLAAAVVYDDLLRWIIENDSSSDEDREPTHYESPSQWTSAHPYLSLSTVERAFRSLKEAGYLKLYGRTREGTPEWTIPLGVGRMDRWKELHRWKEKVNKPKFVYVPIMADPDVLHLQKGTTDSLNSHLQIGTTHLQIGTTHLQIGTTDRQKGTTSIN